jgi:hypothetical protein
MAVAHDAVSESHTGTAGVANVTSFTWNHVPTGSPRSALVFTLAIGANPVTGVTYGGVAMTAVPYTAYDSDTEPGFVQAWFLDNVAAGTQAVVVSRTSNAVVTYATCMTQTADKACEVYTAGVKTRAASGSEQTAASSSATGTSTTWSSLALDDGSPGTNSLRYMAIYSGAPSVSTASTNTTTNGTSASIDFGNYVFFTMRETTPSQGSKTLTITTAISDDLAVIGLAVREVPVDNRNASIVNTGGGVAVASARKGGLLAAVATGGGVAVVASAGAHASSVVSTGGGVVVVVAEKYISARDASIVLTGGGVATPAGQKNWWITATATGGGINAPNGQKGGYVSVWRPTS